MSLNLWQDEHLEGARLEAAAAVLRESSPDVVCLQEVRHDPAPVAGRLAELSGLPFLASLPSYPIGEGSSSGLAVLSRLSHVRTEVVDLPADPSQGFSRPALSVTLALPSGRPARFSTVHLAWGGSAESWRLAEVVALEEHLAASPVEVDVLCGDLNTLPESDTLRYLRGLSSLVPGAFWVDAWELCGVGPGWTSSPENPHAARTAASHGQLPELLPARRIDYLLVRGYVYGRPGCPLSASLAFDVPAGPAGVLASDHWGLEVELWDPPLPPGARSDEAGGE